MECRVYKSTRPTLYCGGCESILNLIWIFSLHFDIRLLDFVALAYIPQNVGWLLETADLLYQSTVDTERRFVSNTQSKFEMDIKS